MVTEDYVSFETAKLLKEKGFDIPCNTYFVEVEKETAKNKFKRKFYHSSVAANRNAYKSEMANHYYFSCPTLQRTIKWLREEKEIFITIGFCDYPALHKSEWIPEVCTHDSIFDEPSIAYNTYEEACEAAIKHCLKNLI